MAYDENAMKGLTDVFEAALEGARAEYVEICQRVKDLQQKLHELDKTTHSEAQIAGVGFSATGADLAWRTWVEQRRRIMMRDLAKLMAHREGVRERLRIANGKAKSFEAVVSEKRRKQLLSERQKAQKQLDFNMTIQSLNS